jgi:hypothetical protein
MPDQEEHDRPENLVEPAYLDVKPAATLQDEANSNNSLEGYAAMNALNNEEIAKQAEELEKERELQTQQQQK